MFDLLFFVNSLLLGVGLAMDAFSVSVANGLGDPNMKKSRSAGISGLFGAFQFAMPIIGWCCVHFIVEKFKKFEPFIPYIALILLLYIGVKMIVGCVRKGSKKENETEEKKTSLTAGDLLIQGVATSIDALSVGFTTQDHSFPMALISSAIIGTVTFALCVIGFRLGKRFGAKWSKAEVFGGIILIAIGIEIFVKGIIK